MNFVDMILYYSKSNPEKHAIILADRIITFGMIAAGIRSVEIAITAASLNSSHVVAVRIENQARHLIVVCALYRLGIVSVSVAGDEDLQKAGAKTDAIISDRSQPFQNLGRLVLLKDDWFSMGYDPVAARPREFSCEAAVARIILSSGTTGIPKAIGMSVRAIEERIITCWRTLMATPWDRLMCLPLLTSGFGFNFTIQALASGRTIVFADSAMDALRMIALYKVDLLVANPQHLSGMVATCRKTPVPMESLKLIVFAGNAIQRNLVPEVRAYLCRDIQCAYGTTESGPVAMSHIDRILEQPGATGLLAPWVEAEIVGDDEEPLPRGRVGRLRVRTTSQGYNLRERADAANQWIYPEDIARISDDGMLILIGRTADAIKVGDTFVSPEQVERALSDYPGLSDVAVVGMPQANGPEIWVAVTAEGKVNEQAIKEFLAKKNPLWHVSRVTTVERIMRNDMGKIVRAQVREKFLRQ